MKSRRFLAILATMVALSLGALTACGSSGGGSGGGSNTIEPCPTTLNGRDDGNKAGENSASETSAAPTQDPGENDGNAATDNCVNASEDGYPTP